MDAVSIVWKGHSCFIIEAENYSVAVDPYENVVPGYLPLCVAANEVVCSHAHSDHNGTEVVKIMKSAFRNPFEIISYETDHDHHNGAKRGKNKINVFKYKDIKIAHLGDLGCVPGADVLENLKGLDCMLIPVGGFFTIDEHEAMEIVKRTNPKTVIPMHFRTDEFGYDKIAHISSFISNNCVKQLDTNTIEISKNNEKGICLLRYMG